MDNLSSASNAVHMLDQATNGTTIERPDVEMKEEGAADACNLYKPYSVSCQFSRVNKQTLATTVGIESLHAPELQHSSQPHSRPLTPARATVTPAPPSQPHPHGSPTRVYLNQNVTPHLLEGMKYLAVYEPEKPLKWLSEFLEKRSKEVEGG